MSVGGRKTSRKLNLETRFEHVSTANDFLLSKQLEIINKLMEKKRFTIFLHTVHRTRTTHDIIWFHNIILNSIMVGNTDGRLSPLLLSILYMQIEHTLNKRFTLHISKYMQQYWIIITSEYVRFDSFMRTDMRLTVLLSSWSTVNIRCV